jgi:hypothetical protein
MTADELTDMPLTTIPFHPLGPGPISCRSKTYRSTTDPRPRTAWPNPNLKAAICGLRARFPGADRSHDRELDWKPSTSSTRSRTIDWNWVASRTNNTGSILPRFPQPAVPGRIRSGRD